MLGSKRRRRGRARPGRGQGAGSSIDDDDAGRPLLRRGEAPNAPPMHRRRGNDLAERG